MRGAIASSQAALTDREAGAAGGEAQVAHLRRMAQELEALLHPQQPREVISEMGCRTACCRSHANRL